MNMILSDIVKKLGVSAAIAQQIRDVMERNGIDYSECTTAQFNAAMKNAARDVNAAKKKQPSKFNDKRISIKVTEWCDDLVETMDVYFDGKLACSAYFGGQGGFPQHKLKAGYRAACAYAKSLPLPSYVEGVESMDLETVLHLLADNERTSRNAKGAK